MLSLPVLANFAFNFNRHVREQLSECVAHRSVCQFQGLFGNFCGFRSTSRSTQQPSHQAFRMSCFLLMQESAVGELRRCASVRGLAKTAK
jgi:hypothetical protein